jgi:hypothetical protein
MPEEHSQSKWYKAGVVLGGFAALGAISYLTVRVAAWVKKMVAKEMDDW